MERRQLLQRRWPGDRAPVPGASPDGAAGTRRRGAAGHRALDPGTVNAESIQVDRVKAYSSMVDRIKGYSNMVNRIKGSRIKLPINRITRIQKPGHRVLTQGRI